jgi:membrane protein required for beta-lactamase induction
VKRLVWEAEAAKEPLPVAVAWLRFRKRLGIIFWLIVLDEVGVVTETRMVSKVVA